MNTREACTQMLNELEDLQMGMRDEWLMDSLPKEWDGLECVTPSPRAKTRVTIRIDSDMLRWFRRMGPDPNDLQKRLNRFVAFCGDTWVSFEGSCMNLYHCAIDLRNDAKAVAFALAVESWMDQLQESGSIQSWRLCRRKLGFGGPKARDFLLEIEVRDLAQLDQAFRFAGSGAENVESRYTAVHQMVGEVDVALYRPFPDPERAERMSLI